MRFGFVAVFSVENEVGIDENISVGYKCESGILSNAAKCSCDLTLLTIE